MFLAKVTVFLQRFECFNVNFRLLNTIYVHLLVCYLNYKMHCAVIKVAIQVYLSYGFTLWDPTNLQCLLQYEIIKSGRILADCCKIIVGLVKMCNGDVKILIVK